MTIAIRNVHRGQVEDLETVLKRHGRCIEAFEIAATPSEPDSLSGISAFRGTVTIKQRELGVQKPYNTGHGSSWVVEFENDLHAGFFG
jgi:hypothetical protein